MENKKFCPMIKDECKEKECAWYVKEFDECAHLSLGESMTELMIMFDYKGAKVEILE